MFKWWFLCVHRTVEGNVERKLESDTMQVEESCAVVEHQFVSLGRTHPELPKLSWTMILARGGDDKRLPYRTSPRRSWGGADADDERCLHPALHPRCLLSTSLSILIYVRLVSSSILTVASTCFRLFSRDETSYSCPLPNSSNRGTNAILATGAIDVGDLRGQPLNRER